jgi:Ferrous iron transport protein B
MTSPSTGESIANSRNKTATGVVFSQRGFGRRCAPKVRFATDSPLEGDGFEPGSRQKVANYPGVTGERKEGLAVTPAGLTVRLIDLPGTYSLRARSLDEVCSARDP